LFLKSKPKRDCQKTKIPFRTTSKRAENHFEAPFVRHTGAAAFKMSLNILHSTQLFLGARILEEEKTI
jgi:hypothetical protein